MNEKKVIARVDVRNSHSNEHTMTIVRVEHGKKSVLRKVIEEIVSDEWEVLESYLSSDEELHE